MKKTERTVAIVGVGLIGRAWAAIFARAGWNVRLTDPHAPTLAAAPGLIRDELHALARHGLAADPDGAAARISVAGSVEDAVKDAEFVQENGPENVDQKIRIFAELDRLAPPDALLVSSTSAIVASRFTEMLPGRARCLVGHPVNPPHLVPLVELCGAPWTAPESIDARARNLSRDRPGAGHRQPRDQRLCPQPAAGRAAGGSVSAGRRGFYLRRRPRSHGQGRPRAALVVPRPVRDHRTQRARRHSGLLRALHRLL